MKVAIPVDDTKQAVCVSFGRTPYFLFFDTETKESTILENPAAEAEGGAGVTAAQFIVDNGAEVLLTIRCGENAKTVFDAAELKVYKTESPSAEENIQLFLEDKLSVLEKFHAGFHGLR